MLTPFYHPHIGGVEKHVRRTAEELISRGHRVTVVTRKHDDSLLEEENIGGVYVHRMHNGSLVDMWRRLFKKRDLIRRADVVHCHDYISFISWYLPFRFLFRSKPVYITFHGFEGMLPIPKRILWMRRMGERLTRGNICIGDFIPKWYGTKPDYISYGGVDARAHAEGEKSDAAVFIGRVEGDSGIRQYVEALRVLKDDYGLDLELDVYGDGTLRGEIEAIRDENGLRIKMHGFVSEPLKRLGGAKIAFVSGYLAMLEAMSAKKLVASVYDNPLKRDYLSLMPDAERMIVISGSPVEMAEKVVRYLRNDGEREALVERAYEFARSSTWADVADTYLSLWEKPR